MTPANSTMPRIKSLTATAKYPPITRYTAVNPVRKYRAVAYLMPRVISNR